MSSSHLCNFGVSDIVSEALILMFPVNPWFFKNLQDAIYLCSTQ